MEESWRLQEAMAHLQEDVARLSEELYQQQREIAELRKYTRVLESRLEQSILDAANASGTPDKEPPPPHY